MPRTKVSDGEHLRCLVPLQEGSEMQLLVVSAGACGDAVSIMSSAHVNTYLQCGGEGSAYDLVLADFSKRTTHAEG